MPTGDLPAKALNKGVGDGRIISVNQSKVNEWPHSSWAANQLTPSERVPKGVDPASQIRKQGNKV